MFYMHIPHHHTTAPGFCIIWADSIRRLTKVFFCCCLFVCLFVFWQANYSYLCTRPHTALWSFFKNTFFKNIFEKWRKNVFLPLKHYKTLIQRHTLKIRILMTGLLNQAWNRIQHQTTKVWFYTHGWSKSWRDSTVLFCRAQWTLDRGYKPLNLTMLRSLKTCTEFHVALAMMLMISLCYDKLKKAQMYLCYILSPIWETGSQIANKRLLNPWVWLMQRWH